MPGGATRSIPKKTGPYMEISMGSKKQLLSYLEIQLCNI